ncbi:MAG: cytochrome C biogenesis protein [Actinobacteria bacterium]|nr:MAG: cytochrome C biogenesis protein [Actinomycetota bacterium]
MDVTVGTMFAAVFAGAASFLSPCVLPLLPGYIGLMSGYSMQELTTGGVSMRRVLWATSLFVLGFTAVFVVVFGAAASILGELLRSPALTAIAGWVIIAMGLFIAVTAVWTPQFLMPLMRERRLDVGRAGRFGGFAPPLMGAAFAFGWTPCIGPFLASALALGATTETMGSGMVVLFFYSLGLGIPFLLTSLLLAKAFTAFAWVKRHMTVITVASGLLLAGFGVLMVTGNIGILSSWFSRLMIRLGLEDWTQV